MVEWKKRVGGYVGWRVCHSQKEATLLFLFLLCHPLTSILSSSALVSGQRTVSAAAASQKEAKASKQMGSRWIGEGGEGHGTVSPSLCHSELGWRESKGPHSAGSRSQAERRGEIEGGGWRWRIPCGHKNPPPCFFCSSQPFPPRKIWGRMRRRDFGNWGREGEDEKRIFHLFLPLLR